MKYRNVKTGAVIDAVCEIAGGDWVPEENAAAVSDSDTAKPKTKAKAKKE